MNTEDLKYLVKEKYGEIAKQGDAFCGCGPACCSSIEYSMIGDDYDAVKGYNADADLGLGCGLPTEFAQIKPGDTVLDLGSGAGNDCFVARALVGETGKVIGLDMTEAMIQKAKSNVQKLGYKNIEFVLGDIEKMPISNAIADVVISNCVLNLVPDKHKAFAEIVRVLKSQGHISVSDVVLKGHLPQKLQQASELYVGCVSGAIQQDEYISIMKRSGLQNIQIQKEKIINLPEELLKTYLNEAEFNDFIQSDVGIYSITVFAEK